MPADETSGVKCPWCGETTAEGQRCPGCGRTAPAAEMRPLGGWVGPAPKQAETPAPGAPRPTRQGAVPPTAPQAPRGPATAPPPSPVRDPRAAWERRRIEREQQAARYAKLSYSQYLALVLKEDHVFAVLLALMALQIILDLVSGSWLLQILGICYAVIFFGVVTFQRWAHTAAVWLMGMGLLGSLLNLFSLALLPILALQFAISDLAIARSWLFWFIATGTYVFVLVVLMERRAYFEGVHARVPPKRRRLKNVLASAKEDLKPIDPYERRAPVGDESPRTTAAERRTQPSVYDPMAETPATQRADAPSPRMPTVSDREAAREERTPAAHDDWQQAPPPRVTCTRCGNEFARGLPGCPHCAAAASAAAAPPAPTDAQAPPVPGPTEGVALPPGQESDDRYRVEPLEPAPGQAEQDWVGLREALSWGHIRDLARQDPVFGALLALLVLQALVVVASGNIVAIVGAIAIIWGILTLNVWAYWGALIISAMLALWHLRLLAQAEEIAGTGGMVLFGAIAGMNLLIVGLLLARRERFG